LDLAVEASETIASRQLAAFEAQFQRLQSYPLLGASREQLVSGLRVIFQGTYAIYYILVESELIILRVLHSARDTKAIAEQGGFEP
jgi:plasmid stabilization system protein ParE